MIYIKSQKEIEIMREGGHILAQIFNKVKNKVRIGIKTKELEDFAVELIKKSGGKPSFMGYRGYPAAMCISINDEVVHGIPGNRTLEEGDVVDLDLGLEYKGYFTDMSETLPVGKISRGAERLIDVTKRCLEIGIKQVKPENHIGDIGYAIQQYAEMQGYGVVRDLVGHGVGKKVHEDPRVPNYGEKGKGERLEVGMTLAIEPMLNMGEYNVHTKEDGWTFVTSDQSLSAHFEHTVAVTKDGCEILTRLN